MKKISLISLTFLLSTFLYNISNAQEIIGVPRIIDGDTVHINNYKIRLEGIDAPEIKQKCKKPFISFSVYIGFSINKSYSCGSVSKDKLIKKINKSSIKCISLSKDRYNRYLATCYKDQTNLNKWLVRNGYAVAYKRYSNKYSNDEIHAKNNSLGVWQGTFIRPEKWRKLN
tara:strand:- start:119 stop:631 length:513 start_codon:yes stop_codon:yes gene_type:complete